MHHQEHFILKIMVNACPAKFNAFGNIEPFMHEIGYPAANYDRPDAPSRGTSILDGRKYYYERCSRTNSRIKYLETIYQCARIASSRLVLRRSVNGVNAACNQPLCDVIKVIALSAKSVNGATQTYISRVTEYYLLAKCNAFSLFVAYTVVNYF